VSPDHSLLAYTLDVTAQESYFLVIKDLAKDTVLEVCSISSLDIYQLSRYISTLSLYISTLSIYINSLSLYPSLSFCAHYSACNRKCMWATSPTWSGSTTTALCTLSVITSSDRTDSIAILSARCRMVTSCSLRSRTLHSFWTLLRLKTR
jgi:hypothetical protein